MFLLTNLCFMCLGSYKNIKSISIENNEEILVLKKLKYCVPEMDVNFEVSKYICTNCISKLECLYTFKQMCLHNNTCLKNYFQTSTDKPYKHLSVKLTDIKYQNDLHPARSHQILATVGSDELRTENNGTYIEEKTFENKTQCVDELDTEESHELVTEVNGTRIKEDIFNVLEIKESHLLFNENDCITVKEEFCASENNIDVEFYQSIKSEPISNVFVSNVEYIEHEDFKYCNNSTNPKENNLKEKNKIKCLICDKEFVRKQSLKYHLKNHAGMKDYSCSICKQKFVNKSSLSRHEKNHKGIKNYECLMCKKRFLQKCVLIQHEKIHTDLKNYECSICKRRFTHKNNMIQHEKIHKGIKEFQCLICKKKFISKGQLSNHEKIHVGIKNFECSICKKKFLRKGNLLEHENIHVGIKNFECSICKKKFLKKSNLTTHEKNHYL